MFSLCTEKLRVSSSIEHFNSVIVFVLLLISLPIAIPTVTSVMIPTTISHVTCPFTPLAEKCGPSFHTDDSVDSQTSVLLKSSDSGFRSRSERAVCSVAAAREAPADKQDLQGFNLAALFATLECGHRDNRGHPQWGGSRSVRSRRCSFLRCEL